MKTYRLGNRSGSKRVFSRNSQKRLHFLFWACYSRNSNFNKRFEKL